MTSVMWFRKDLRLSDNKALAKACEESEELILFYVSLRLVAQW